MGIGARRVRTAAAAALVLAGLTVATAATAQEAPPADPLLVEGDGPTRVGSGQVVRHRPVTVDAAALRARGPSEVRLELFADAEVVADLSPSDSGVTGWQAWSGTVAGDADSSVVVTTDGATTSALVVTDGSTYRVRTTADGEQLVQEIAPFAGEGDDTIVPPPPDEPTSAPSPAAGDAGEPEVAGDLPPYPVIDVLVGYTPQALSLAGSVATLNAEIAQAISLSNTAFADSGIDGRFNLAGTQAVPENLSCSSLAAVRATGDGVADGLHTRRDQLGADVVTVLTGPGCGGTGSCGIGYRPVTLDQIRDGSNKFSLASYECAADNLSLPHEIGHNLGMNHDRYVAVPGEANLFPYDYGYAYPAGGWRTVMAYNNVCIAAGTSCTRLVRFSNPDLTYGGVPTGRPTSAADSADGRTVLNQTFPLVADTRATPAPFTSWARFVQQQARDFQFGATVPTATVTDLSARLTAGTLKPAAHVETLMRGAFATAHAPVTRLYQAYYLRLPDTGGLDYWVGRFRSGLSVNKMSQYFSGTPEFRTLYGTLTNRQFVELVYENVLGRAGEPSGVAYWTDELNSGRRNRGSVMVGFSESPENRAKLTHTVDAVMTYRGLLGRVPTSAERATFVSRRTAGATVPRIMLELMATTPYANRVVT